MINYYLPGFAEGQPIYKILFDLKKNYPECFYENINISKIYGSFPNMIWNGGSFWVNRGVVRNRVRDYFQWYSNKNVILQLNFTNIALTENHLNDVYCNMVLEEANNYSNFIEILVSSSILENYIREKYPNLKIDKSIIGTTQHVMEDIDDNLEYHLKEAEKYNKYVLPRKYTKEDYLKEIPKEKRDKFEILVNDPCPINCPYLFDHYMSYSKAQIFGEINDRDIKCRMGFKNSPFRFQTHNKDQYNFEQVRTILEPMGYSEIKLSGRTDAIMVITAIVPYLIKPEYQRDIYMILLNRYKTNDIAPPNFS